MSEEISALMRAVERIETAQHRSQQDIELLHHVLWTGTNGNTPLTQRITRIEEGQNNLKAEVGKLVNAVAVQQAASSSRSWDLSKIGISSVVGVCTTLLVLFLKGDI